MRKKKNKPLNEVEQVFESFWKQKVCKTNGKLDLQSVQNELHDYKKIIDEVTKVYQFITEGNFNRIDYDSEIIIGYCKQSMKNHVANGLKNYRDALQISDTSFVQQVTRVLSETMGVDEQQNELNVEVANKLLQILKDNGYLILKS